MTTSQPTIDRRAVAGAKAPQLLALVICLVLFTIILVLPLIALFSKAFMNNGGQFVGLENYIKYFDTPTLSESVWNTIDISLRSTVFSLVFGLIFAYALTRTHIAAKRFFRYAALIPIFIPTLVHAIGLVYLFGKQGIFTRMGFEIEIYGHTGIVLSEIIYTFPQAFLMFFVALEFVDGRLYEAADSMGVSAVKQFFRITLPEIKFTVVNVFFVCFTLAFTDFGAPKVIGGSYNVLATDIYKQVAGQFNMNMGAVVGTLLLIPAVASFAADRLLVSRNSSVVNAKATALKIKPSRSRDVLFFLFCALITLFFLILIASLFIGALTEYYPYKMGFTLKNFVFDKSTGGIESFFNSLKMALCTALFGTVFVFIYAYIMEKTSGFGLLKRYGRLLSVLPLALPGMVIGLSFIFFFNNKDNPFHFIYGTIIILTLSNILHYFSVPFLTATSCLRKLDKEFESVSDSMNVPRYKTFLFVSVPLSLSALLEIFMYYFVNSMVTVSAVVFLYGAGFRIAAISITHMEEAGNIAQAAAMSLLILFINILVRALYEAAVKGIASSGKRQGGKRRGENQPDEQEKTLRRLRIV